MTPTARLYRFARRASAAPEWAEDLGWYDRARALVSDWGREASLIQPIVAAVVSVLSPQVPWAYQRENTARFIRAELDKPGSGRYAGYGTNVAKARQLLRGASPDRVLGGEKVRAFYAALMGDDGAVVVDRHMANAMRLGRLDRRGEYARGVEAVWRVSGHMGVAPVRLQAAVWCAWRRIEEVPF
jgi:hypothetical protein